MRYATYGAEELGKYKICILVPQINKDIIKSTYIDPFGIDPEDVLVIDLHRSETKKKTPAAEMKAYIEDELTSVLNELSVEYVVITDGDYFKTMSKKSQAEKNLGYVLEGPFGPWKLLYAPNFQTLFYDPEKVRTKIEQSMHALESALHGAYRDPGEGIIKFSAYPKTADEIEEWLEKLIEADRPLTCDIEAFSLKHPTSGIGTISFAWTKNEGIAFPVDLSTEPARIRRALKSFFMRFKSKLMYHRIAFDAYILIYQLFMDDVLDTEGMLNGLNIMLTQWDCTQLITYLATNSCSGNKLGLKDQAQDFAGNYAIDEIKDIRNIPLNKLLEYNLVDSLCTWHVWEKHWDTLVADQQLDIYQNLFQPAMLDIIQMQLTGMPIDMERVAEVRAIMDADEALSVAQMQSSPVVLKFTHKLNELWVIDRNTKLKVKRVTMADANEEFNPNSAPQLQLLLYDMLGLPVLSKTDSGLPSTDGDTIIALRHHTGDQEVLSFLNALMDYKAVNKLTTSFLPAMENATLGPDGWHYLFGNFNLGGTVSGRLSSSQPNLQNLPSNGKSDKQRAYAKLIKSCFKAPLGWVFVGLDFDSLEDKISGLTTKDPNKLKVYTDGYDGHSLRAFSYFREQMPDILQSEGRRVFKISQNGSTHYLFEGDEVTLLDGRSTRIELVA